MKSQSPSSSKFRQTLFLFVFIGLAMWGGWGLARMGDHRAKMKAESELSRIAGEGSKTEVAALATEVPVAVPVAPPTPAPIPVPPEPVATPPVVEEVEAVAVVEAPPVAVVTPPVLILSTVPGAEVRLMVDGELRPIGLADAKGIFRTETLPAGPIRLSVTHRDYAEVEPLAANLAAGTTSELALRPEPLPGSLSLLADEGTTVFLDGKKVGENTVMLGKVPSARELTLRLVPRSGEPTARTLTLVPRESRLLDLRTKPAARAEAPLGNDVFGAIAPAPTDAALPAPGGAPTPAAPVVEVREQGPRVAASIVAVAHDSGLVSLRGVAPNAGAAPVAVGADAILYAPGTPPVRLVGVRTFGVVSVCKAEVLPAGLASGSAELTVSK